MKMLIVFLLTILALYVYVLHSNRPRYEPRTVSFGPASYTESVCVENCADAH